MLSPVALRTNSTANFINPTETVQIQQERILAPAGNDIYIEFEVKDTGQGIPEVPPPWIKAFQC
jgi:signal transduction histidine kinase